MKKIALGFILLFISCQGGVKEGKQAPDFTLKSIDGTNFTLSEHLGKVIIIDFWATWCGPCKAEIPHFIKLYEKYSQKGFLMVGIALDAGGLEVVKPFYEKNKMNYPVVIGSRDVADLYGGINAIPTTFVVDRKGRIVKKVVGYRDIEFFESLILKLL